MDDFTYTAHIAKTDPEYIGSHGLVMLSSFNAVDM